jgi:four helix bundle protein
MDFAALVYSAAKSFPKDETFGLSMQMRRAAVSIPSNIAEGQGRGTDAELCRFLHIALGSLHECETQILLSERLGLLADCQTVPLLATAAEVGRLIHGLIRSKR